MSREKEFNKQLDKYSKLNDNERIFVVDKRLLSFDRGPQFRYTLEIKGNKDRIAKYLMLKWGQRMRGLQYTLKRDITTEDIFALDKALENYQYIFGLLTKGLSNRPLSIEKIDIMEGLISNRADELYEAIEFKKKGYIPENFYESHEYAHNSHVVTVIESDKYFTIKEIYCPYSGIIIQLPI